MALSSDLGLIDALVSEDVSDVCLGMGEDVFGGVESARDLLSASMVAVGIDAEESVLGKSLDHDTDALLNSILTGGSNLDDPFSDDSSCSLAMETGWMSKPDGADIDDVLQIVKDDLDEDECYDTSRMQLQVVNPVTFETTSAPAPIRTAPQTVMIRKITPSSPVVTSMRTAPTTTIVLPAVTTRASVRQQDRVVVVSSDSCSSSKRRRVSTSSSSDSGMDDASSTTTEDHLHPMSNAQRLSEVGGCVRVSPPAAGQRYPALILSEEERRLCEREGLRLPTHYPLTREEEKNLKRIRRKIRNKVSAQDSRKRKKEYLDVMEVRVRKCSDENHDLQRKVELLERQNQSLSGQLQRLHQIIVNKGGLVALLGRQNQSQTQSQAPTQQPAPATGSAAATSTAMMVLLLSTALFLIPGINREQTDAKNEIDIFQAVKMPPIPGQSRSLLHFGAHVKQEYGASHDAAMSSGMTGKADLAAAKAASVKAEPGLFRASDSPIADHDYFVVSSGAGGGGKRKLEAATAAGSYIEEDVPALGYGLSKAAATLESQAAVPPVAATATVEKRTINITRGDNDGGMRTVILHVPKEFHEVYIN